MRGIAVSAVPQDSGWCPAAQIIRPRPFRGRLNRVRATRAIARGLLLSAAAARTAGASRKARSLNAAAVGHTAPARSTATARADSRRESPPPAVDPARQGSPAGAAWDWTATAAARSSGRTRVDESPLVVSSRAFVDPDRRFLALAHHAVDA